MGLALGARPARLAHRVLGDGRGRVRARVRDPRRRARPRLPAPRERARAVARARPRVRAHLDAQRHARVRRREDVEVARQRRLAPQRARHVGARGRAALLHDARTGASRSTSPTRRSRRRRRRSRRFRNVFRSSPSEPVGDWAALRGGARRRLQHARGARAPARLARPRAAARAGSTLFGLGSLAERERGAAPRSSSSPRQRQAARAARDFAEADRLRDEIAAARLGGARRAPAASSSSRR